MPGKGARVFSQEFKEAAVLRILAGERVQALAAELHVWPKLLYDWWSRYDRGGAAALRRAGRPPRSAGEVIEPTAPLPPRAVRHRRRGRRRADRDDEAGKRIAELERKVGEQALELDFFRRALRYVKAPPRPSDGRGGSASSRCSRRNQRDCHQFRCLTLGGHPTVQQARKQVTECQLGSTGHGITDDGHASTHRS
jgi:transposase